MLGPRGVLPIQERLIGQREPNETFMHLVGLRTEVANIHQPFMVIQRELAEQRPHQLPREGLHEYRARMYALASGAKIRPPL